MTDFPSAVAAVVAQWEHAEDCTLDHLLLGLSEEVGVRKSAEYWTRDRKGWEHHATGKLRHCLEDLAEVCKDHSVVELFASRPAPGSPDLSVWYRHLENPQTIYVQVRAGTVQQAERQRVPA